MSFVITTDVFCDGDECSIWIEGVTGTKIRKTDAWSNSKSCGWVKVNGKHLCRNCSEKKEKEF